jgi:hypothetical protein
MIGGYFGRLRLVESAATIQIGSSSRGLLLTWAPTATVNQVNANLVDEGLSASRTVYHGYASGFRDLFQYFEEMERDWRGWDGERVWESLEGDLRIEARHEHGHVQLRVTLRKSVAEWGRSGWIATADVTVDPGEQLSHVVRDLRALAPA